MKQNLYQANFHLNKNNSSLFSLLLHNMIGLKDKTSRRGEKVVACKRFSLPCSLHVQVFSQVSRQLAEIFLFLFSFAGDVLVLIRKDDALLLSREA